MKDKEFSFIMDWYDKEIKRYRSMVEQMRQDRLERDGAYCEKCQMYHELKDMAKEDLCFSCAESQIDQAEMRCGGER